MTRLNRMAFAKPLRLGFVCEIQVTRLNQSDLDRFAFEGQMF